MYLCTTVMVSAETDEPVLYGMIQTGVFEAL